MKVMVTVDVTDRARLFLGEDGKKALMTTIRETLLALCNTAVEQWDAAMADTEDNKVRAKIAELEASLTNSGNQTSGPINPANFPTANDGQGNVDENPFD
jgi:hypothetical protein